MLKCLLCLILCLSTLASSGQEAAPKNTELTKAMQNPSNLREASVAAAKALNEKRFADAATFIETMDKFGAKEIDLNFQRGMLSFGLNEHLKAEQYLLAAQKEAPDSYLISMNLAQVYFCKHDFDAANNLIDSILKEIGESKNKGLSNLLTFQKYICELHLDPKKAEAIAEGFSELSDTPEHYYGKAAKFFVEKNPEEAKSWTASASRIYRSQVIAPFLDCFYEMGWLESFAYGHRLEVKEPVAPAATDSLAP